MLKLEIYTNKHGDIILKKENENFIIPEEHLMNVIGLVEKCLLEIDKVIMKELPDNEIISITIVNNVIYIYFKKENGAIRLSKSLATEFLQIIKNRSA